MGQRFDEKLLQEQTLKALRNEVRKAKKGPKISPMTNEQPADQVKVQPTKEVPLNQTQMNEEPVEQLNNKPEPKEEPVEQPDNKPEFQEQTQSSEPSIYDIARNKTAEDAKIKDKKPPPEEEEDPEEEDEATNRAKDFNDTSNISDDPTVITKESLKLKAKTRTEIVDAILVFIFCLLSLDFEFQHIERWKLKKERKDSITQAWYGVLLEKKKHGSPSKELWFLVIGSYFPFLIMAIAGIFKSFRLKREEAAKAQQALEQKQREKREQEKNAEENKGDHHTNGNNKTNSTNEAGPANQESINFKPDPGHKPRRPGPHKTWCDHLASKGKKPCNCKN